MQEIRVEKIDSDVLLSQFEGITQRLKRIESNLQPKEPPEYLTRQEVADMLKMSLPTLHRLTKKNLLTSYRIGQKVLYKRKEVETALVQINGTASDE